MAKALPPKPVPARRRHIVLDETAQQAAQEKSLAEARKEKRQKDKDRFLKVLDDHLGIISFAAEEVGIPRRTIYQWMDEDLEFRRKVKDIDHKQVDFVERKLLENIRAQDTRAIVFYLSTKGRSRGYTTRVEVMTPQGESLKADVTVVDHTEARSEMGDQALGKALKAALRAIPSAFSDATRIAASNGAIDRKR